MKKRMFALIALCCFSFTVITACSRDDYLKSPTTDNKKVIMEKDNNKSNYDTGTGTTGTGTNNKGTTGTGTNSKGTTGTGTNSNGTTGNNGTGTGTTGTGTTGTGTTGTGTMDTNVNDNVNTLPAR